MKGKKYIVPVMLASLVGAPAAILNNSVVSNASAYDKDSTTSILGPEIQLSGYEAKYEKGDDITIPKVDAENLGTLKFKVTVTDPLGETTIFGEDGQGYAVFKNDGTDKVKANYAGTYTIKYEVYGASTITTTLIDEISILVVGDEYSLDMPTNSYHVVPSEMKYTANRVVTFPVPEVFKNGESLETLDGEIQLVITKTGGDSVVLKSSDATQFVAKDASGNTTGEAYFKHTFTTAGRYRYKYQYKVGSEIVEGTDSKTFKLSETTTIEDTVLNFSTVSDIKTTGVEVGDLVELPEVKVFEKGNSSKTFDAYTKIVVTYLGPETVASTAVELEEDGFSFIPKYTGNYQVEYKISIPNMNGLSVENAKKYIISGVVDNDAAEIFLTGSYNVSEDGKVTKGSDTTDLSTKDAEEVVEILGDMTSYVDSYYVLDSNNEVTVQLPAAYAVDNHADIKGITITRELYKKGNSSNTFRIVKLGNDDETETDASKVAQYTFSKSGNGVGDYVVRYYVKDDSTSGNGKYYSYYIYVRDSETLKADWVPTISLDSNADIPAQVEKDETITFAPATAVDKHDGVIYDKNLDIHTYYAFSDAKVDTAQAAFALANKVELKENEDGEYEIDVKTAQDSNNYVYIVTTAKNSYGENTAYAFKEVKINRINADDTVKPTLKIGAVEKAEDVATKLDNLDAAAFNTAILVANEKTGITLGTNGLTADGKGAFDQKETVKLPAMTFIDNGEDITLSVYVTYLSNDGKTVNKVDITSYDRNSLKVGDRYYYTISNANFVADYAKMYTVTFVARDVNNMFSCTSFGVYVNDTVAPVIKVKNNSKFAESLEVGSWFNVPEATVEDNGDVTDIKASWKVVSSGGAFQTNNNGFRPLDTGTYYVVYTAKDESDLSTTTPEKQYSVEVVATEKPQIKLVASAYEEEYDWDYENKSVIFAVPKATAEDKLGSVIVGTPSVKDGNDQDVTAASASEAEAAFPTEYDATKYYYYKAQSQGNYTVSYTAKRWDKLTSTTTLSIEIGDCDAPEIKWVNKEKDFTATVNEGDTWQFNMNMVNIEDNLDDTIDADNITVTMTDPDGTVLDNGDDYKYTFDKEGKYTFKIQAKDTAGNNTYNDFSYTITVKAKDPNTVEKNTVLGMSPAVGTTLIVLSVVVLGGVVVYFVLSSKNAMKPKKDRKNKK